MATTLTKPHATATVDTVTVDISDGRVALDALAVPYGAGEFDIPLTEGLQLDDMDPRADRRVMITAGDAVAGTTRTFNLGLRARAVDHVAKTVTLAVATDEALLQDYATLVEDNGARQFESSLRAVCNYVLGKVLPGTTLAAGPDDANVTAYWAVTNMFPDPSAENPTPTNAWTATTGAPNLTRQATAPLDRATVLRVQATATTNISIAQKNPVTATPGQAYTLYTSLKSDPSNPKTAYILLRFLDAAGTIIRDFNSPQLVTTSAWVRRSMTAVAPVNAAQVQMHVVWLGPHVVGNLHYVDATMMYAGAELIPYFDGAVVNSATYTYEWQGTADASASTRTPIVERPPELYVWKPGTTAWEFLEPLTASAGLRLYCDESRVWRLINPATYTLPGSISIAPWNATQGTDTISREDSEVFATGVVARYGWTDTYGIARTAFDAAGAPGKVFVVDYARAYPGPGAAKAILARRNGTGRTQAVVGIVQWNTTPGMAASITLPEAPQQQGKVSAVTFDLSTSGLMDMTSRGLIDVPAGAWDAAPPAQTWNTVTGTWDTYLGLAKEEEDAA